MTEDQPIDQEKPQDPQTPPPTAPDGHKGERPASPPAQPATVNPQPTTEDPRPATANSQPATLHPGTRVGLVLMGLICLAVSGAALWQCGWQLAAQLRKPLDYLSIPATVLEYVPAIPYLDDDGQIHRHPAHIQYQCNTDPPLVGLQVLADPPADNDYEPALAKPWSKGDTLLAYYDPADPRIPTLVPVPDPTMLSAVLALLPLAVLALRLIYGGLLARPLAPSDQGGWGQWALLVHTILSWALAGAMLIFAPRLPWLNAWILAAGAAVIVLPLAAILLGGMLADLAARKAGTVPLPGRDKALDALVAFDLDSMPAPRLPKGYSLSLLVLAVLLAVVVAWPAWRLGQGAYENWTTGRKYATVEGYVESSIVQDVTEGAPVPLTRYEPVILYRYHVGELACKSNHFADGLSLYEQRSGAEALAAKYPKGQIVTVYYDPAKPNSSVLDPRLPAVDYPLLLALGPPALLALALAAKALFMPLGSWRVRRFLRADIRLPWRVPLWGSLLERADDLALQARGRSALSGWIAYAAATAATIAIVGARTGPQGLTFSTACYAEAACLCAGAIGWLWGRQKRGGILIFDIDNRQLRLLETDHDIELGFDQVQAWTLRWVLLPTRRGGPLGIAPLLGVLTDEGLEAPIRLLAPRGPIDCAPHVAAKVAQELAYVTGAMHLAESAASNGQAAAQPPADAQVDITPADVVLLDDPDAVASALAADDPREALEDLLPPFREYADLA